MTPDDIISIIDAKRQRQRELTKTTWYAPKHIAEALEPERNALELEIHELKVQLFRALGGTVDTASDYDLQAGE
jgi:hypothetical protein